MSNSERHQEKRRQRSKQKQKENNMRTYRGKDEPITLVSKSVPEKTWLQRLGARIKALWPGGKTTKEKEPRT